MIRRPPRSTRTDTLFPYTTLFRSFAAGGAIFLRLLLKPRVGENAKAPEAWPARGRQDDLAADRELIAEVVNVHAHIDTGDHHPSAEGFEFAPFAVGIDAADDDVAFGDRLGSLLPPACKRQATRLPDEPPPHSFGAQIGR